MGWTLPFVFPGVDVFRLVWFRLHQFIVLWVSPGLLCCFSLPVSLLVSESVHPSVSESVFVVALDEFLSFAIFGRLGGIL